MMLALNAPSALFCSNSPPHSHLLGKLVKNRLREFIRRFTKKAHIAWLFEPILYCVPSVRKNVWRMAVLGVRILGSGHYRDEKFSFFWIGARGSTETLTFLFGVTSIFLTILGFWPLPLLDSRLVVCKAAAYFMLRSSIKANDINDTDYSFIVSTKSRALFFNKWATKSRAFIFG